MSIIVPSQKRRPASASVWGLGLLGACWLAAPAQADAPLRRAAVAVGANDGGAGRVALRFAHADARSFAQVMTDLGGLSPTDRTLLFDPTPDELLASLRTAGEALRTSPGRSELVFYYSGHSDEEGLLLGGQRVDYDTLRAALDDLPVDVRVAVLDSCASGAMVRRKGGVRVPAFAVDASSDVEGSAYLTSASADESAQEADRLGGSYFTHALTTGLRGAADVSGDGRVTLHEAYRFAFDETLARTERTALGPQHANYDFQLSGTGDLVLTDLTYTTASLVLDETTGGRATVRDGDGRLVAELIKPSGRLVELGVEPGRYRVTLSRDGRYAETVVDVATGEHHIVRSEILTWSAGEVATARGDVEGTGEAHRVPVRFSVLPVSPRQDEVDVLAVDLLAGRSHELDGTAIGFGAHFVDEDARGAIVTLGYNDVGGDQKGLMLTLGANRVGGDAEGQGALGANFAGGDAAAQVALGANFAGGDLRGAQASVGANVAGGEVRGLQGTVGGNLAVGELRGGQVSVGVNIAGRDVRGAQLTVGANLAAGHVRGAQLAAGVNVAESVTGAQISILNIGGDVDGGQIGLVNIAKDVKGTQIGLLNIANDVDGVPIGLLSIVKRGRHDLSVFATESDPLNVDFKLGSRSMYTVAGLGTNGTQQHYAALGLGGHIPAGPAWVDLDVSALNYTRTPFVTRTEPVLVGRGRATLGVEPVPHLSVFVGASLNVDSGLGGGARDVPLSWIEGRSTGVGTGPTSTTEVFGWVGGFAGIQVGMRNRPRDEAE